MKKGYTVAELLIVVAVITVLALVSFVSLTGYRNRNRLDSAASQMTALLREAQSRSASQASSTSWGVRFDNGFEGAVPFFALFGSSYASSSRSGYYSLPPGVGYATSSVGLGSYADIVFGQISGRPNGSSSVVLYLLADPLKTATISVSAVGAVSFSN